MSIIGEMYEEEIWKSNKDLKEKLEQFLVYLKSHLSDTVKVYDIEADFRERFKTELNR